MASKNIVNRRARCGLFVANGLLAFVVLLAPERGEAVPVEIGAFQDNTLYEHPTGLLSNGAGPGLFVGRTGEINNSIRRGLISFDVAGALPAAATITAANLTLHVRKASNATSQAIDLHRITSAWGEAGSIANLGAGGGGAGGVALTGDATWMHRISPLDAWNNPGGDFDEEASATQSVGGIGTYNWSSAQLVSDVQDWLNAPETNFGWLLQGNETSGGTAKVLATREDPALSLRPVLMIEYDLPAFGADFNRDGDVDRDDLLQWESDFGRFGADADADGDGDSDGDDFLAWQREYGSMASGSASVASAPEPSTSLVGCAAAVVALGHFRLFGRSARPCCRRGPGSH